MNILDQEFSELPKLRSEFWITLGPILLNIKSNMEVPFFGKYFSRFQYQRSAGGRLEADYSIRVYEMPFDEIPNSIIAQHASTYRSKVMRDGYYISDYHGPPIICIEGQKESLLFGQGLDLIVWRYFVKYLLTTQAVDLGFLHFKGAAISWEGEGYLIVSPGGGGKTTFLNAVMELGAQFVSNTHALVNEELQLKGIVSNMRFRSIPEKTTFDFPGAIIGSIGRDEKNVDPSILYGVERLESEVPLAGIIFLERATGNVFNLTKVESEDAVPTLEYMSLATSFYGLKYDILEYCNNDMRLFGKRMKETRIKLENVCRQVPVYHLAMDVMNSCSCTALVKFLNTKIP